MTIIPVRQVYYESRISGRTEYLPVAIAWMSKPSTDIQLLETVERCLERTGRPAVVLTGEKMFSTDR